MEKLIWAWWAWILKEYLKGENEIENYKGKYFANKTIEKVNPNYNFKENPTSVFYPLTNNNVTTTFTTEKTTSTILSKLLNFYFSFRKQPTMKTFSLNNSTANISQTYLQNTSSIIINSGQLVNFSKPFFSSTLLTSLTSQSPLYSFPISTTNSSFSFVTVQPSVLKKNFISHVTAKTNSRSFQYQHNINETNHIGITDLFSMLKNSGKSSSSLFLNYNATDTIMKSSNSTYALIRTQDLPHYQQNYVRNNSSSNWSLTSKIFSKIIDLYSALYNFSNFSLLSSSPSITVTTSSIISPRPEQSQSNIPNYNILMSFNETNTNSTIEDIYKESESLFYDIILNCVNGNLTLDNCCNDFRSQTYSDNLKSIDNNDIGSDLFLINSSDYNQTINCTSFTTISLGEYDSESPLQLITTFSTAIILGIIILATVIGNVFVIAAILLEKNLQSVSNYLILSLAVADLLVACLVMPLSAVYEISQKWKMGPELCDMWTSTDVLCCTASILHLVAIALDRYWAVTNIDYIHQRTGRRIGIMIIIIWGLSFSVSIAPLLGWKDQKWHDRISKELKCIISQDIGYQVFATASSFYVPLLVILVLYWRIFQTARKRIRRRQQVTATPTVSGSLIATTTGSSGGIAAAVVTVIGKPLPTISETTTAFTNISSSHTSPEKGSYAMGMDNIENDLSTAEISTCGTEPGPLQSSELHGRKQGKLLTMKTTRLKIVRKKISTSVDSKRERKAAKTLAIITSAFVCCWLPFFALAILLPICQCNISPTVMSLSLWLGYFNSTLNPIIYTIFSPEFRHAFKRLLCGRRNSIRKHGRCLKR